MTFCTCGHDLSAHSEEGVGYCFGSKPNGDPCDCERFHAEPAPAEALIGGAPYIPDHEREKIEAGIRRQVRDTYRYCGQAPTLLVVFLPQDDFGKQRPILFELCFDGERWFYQADGSFELAGRPGETWRVAL